MDGSQPSAKQWERDTGAKHGAAQTSRWGAALGEGCGKDAAGDGEDGAADVAPSQCSPQGWGWQHPPEIAQGSTHTVRAPE